MIDRILHNYAFGLSFAKMLAADIPDGQMCRQPGGLKNHPAWTLGHMAGAAAFAVKLLGGRPDFPEAWSGLFGRGSTPVEDPAKYPTKELLLAALERQHAAAAEAFAAADAHVLDAPTPDEDFRHIMPTIGDGVVFVLTQHEWQHLGELCAWRQAMGLPRVAG